MELLQTLLAFLTPIGLALFALIITREGQKDRAAENLRRDKRDEWERDQRTKESQQSMLLFATLSGKQDASTATILKSGVDTEARVAQQISTSETTIKGRVETVGAANIARLDKIDKALMLIQSAINAYPDPDADAKYDRALKAFNAKLDDISEDITAIRADVAFATEVGTANTSAIADVANSPARATSEVAAAVVPAEVVITDVSDPAAKKLASALIQTADAGAATEGGEELGKTA